MLRFCEYNSANGYKKGDDTILFNKDIWEQGKRFFAVHRNEKSVPVIDAAGNVVCFAWQDEVANQELRMLNEIMEEHGALQFEELYSKYSGVMIQGCNELAAQLCEYLRKRKIAVILTGKYWDYLEIDTEIIDKSYHNLLVIYAEGTWEHFNVPCMDATRTSSVEFDCIYQLYMENVRAGKICNAKRSLEQFIQLLKGRNVFLLGEADYETEDAFDLFMHYGVEIKGFLRNEKDYDGMQWLGKEILTPDEIRGMSDLALVDCTHKDSVLGLGKVDHYAYQGYKRDESFFFLKDYMDIPDSKLTCVLQDKTVVLIGDELLCHKLRRFFIKTGKRESCIVDYEKFNGEISEREEVIGIIAVLEYVGAGNAKEQWWWNFHNCKRQLKEKNILNYTGYYSRFESYVGLEGGERKVMPFPLINRGVILGCINAFSGNIFIRECLDNHPNILSLGYDMFEHNLFSYCIRLEETGIERLIPAFWKLVRKEMGEESRTLFFDRNMFDKTCMEYLDKMDHDPTSQELFVIFYAAYTRMRNNKINDISEYYMYWEPHEIDRGRMQVFAKWFAYQNINGFLMYGVRNSIAQRGSCLNYMNRTPLSIETNRELVRLLCEPWEEYRIAVKGWKGIEVRFEELKLNPRYIWGDFCDTLGIPWSDTLLETTKWGQDYNNEEGFAKGYDVTPVYKIYSEYISALDQLRIQICNADFQKKYGYPYVNCLTFTRRELQELFRKEFKIEERVRFINPKDRLNYYINKIEWIQNCIRINYNKAFINRLYGTNCWDAEEDIMVQLKKCGIIEDEKKQYYEDNIDFKNEIEGILSLFDSNRQIILYGMGKNAELVLSYLKDDIKSRLVYCDQKARDVQMFYKGKKVIAPEEICSAYKNYYIFVTSNLYYKDIECELLNMGIRKSQIIKNRITWHM